MISVDKFGRSCNIIDDPYAQVCVPDKVKKMNAKVFNLMFGGNETRFLVQHDLCEFKCELNKCNSSRNKQKWNDDVCQCECTKLDD